MQGKVLLLILTFLRISVCLCQHQAGFYLQVETKKDCPHWVSTLDSKNRYCVTAQPILNEIDFESVSDVEYDYNASTKSVTLTLTKKGYSSIQMLTKKFQEKKLLLVVKDRLIGFFDFNEKLVKQIVIIKAPIESKEIDWLLKEMKGKQRRN